ncbi:pentatricopeptide repeat-containing protein 5, mitochondrial [Echria macrotheca]|uniref:Pentatricopeptide repeat-containing protein 5, mitochondrial n=1 Tax=Echria macrotheca TaxID=438768 RepID=A0AAJ0BL69_9PEZI|nr:pentatricopeptide repeat-containing protein 5, mitochondrial [Echria macrotheca]
MPSVYSSVFQNFIRQGFAKSFTHGYAQSVVAATHPHVLNPQNRPSFARRNSARVGRLATLGLQTAFHTSSIVAGPTEHKHEKLPSTGALDAYFEHVQKTQEEEEWVQFQFPKRIEWKPTPAAILLGPEAKGLVGESEEVASHDGVPSIPPESEAALAHIDAALEDAIEVRKQLDALEEEVESLRAVSPALAEQLEEHIRTRTLTPISRARTPASIARSVTPPVDPQSQTYADHLTKLSEAARYAEIPAVFEAMLVSGVKPIAAAYNALLMAAIHLPSEKFEIVSKALDVYTDMLRRKVHPDSDTYNILVGLLASRSLEVTALKKSLEDKRLRFGGMDEPGKFMFASHELEHAILSEDDRLDLALKLFNTSVESNKAVYSSETYHQLISACAQSSRLSDMLYLFEHMESNRSTPFAATFPAMITAFANSGDLVSAVECYNEYRSLAIANDNGEPTLLDRLDAQVYAAVINAYVISDKVEGAMKFYKKIVEEYGVRAADIKDAIVAGGFVKGFVHRGIYQEALNWAQEIETQVKASSMSEIATIAADHDDKHTAVAAYANVNFTELASPTMALLAMSIRAGDVVTATRYWDILSSPEMRTSSAFVEPTAMYAVAMIGSGQVAQGLTSAEWMFQRIRDNAGEAAVADEIEEALEFIHRYMSARGIVDPREAASQVTPVSQPYVASPYPSTPAPVPAYEDTFDPYAHNTDFKGSSLISDELEGSHGRKGSKLNDALSRFRNMRRAGRHPRYITYAKLISAAARDGKMDLCHDILAMARTDVPLLPQYAVVRYGWSSILDAMVGACLTLGDRTLAKQYHQELLAMGSTPSANTFGLYITTLKESTKTFDEASEAVKIFHRAKAEGVEPSSFLYNALIGKLGKARRIDDCLFYFAEMRGLGIKPTSVTYGTIVNALCRVSDEAFAEQLFDEMEAMPNYKARPAPYNSMMQFFLTTKRDKTKVLEYYERMKSKGIAPTSHTFKLLVDTHATLEPVDMMAAEAVLDMIRSSGQRPEPVHYASLIHARGCVLHDMEGARRVFDSVMKDPTVAPNPCLFQALFEAMVANHKVADTEAILSDMHRKRVDLTPYIANTLIHGWAAEKNIAKAKKIYAAVGRERREPSTYEAMTRAYLAVEERENANSVVTEMLSRGYPNAVVNKVLELLGGGNAESASVAA